MESPCCYCTTPFSKHPKCGLSNVRVVDRISEAVSGGQTSSGESPVAVCAESVRVVDAYHKT